MNLPPEIQKDIDQINNVCEDLKMKMYIVGGLPRDLVFGYNVDEDTDLDITEGNGNAFDLAFFVSAKYNLPEPVVYENSGTALVTMQSGRSIEFHNAFFNVPHIIDQLYVMGIEPTPINKDVYSRDFTINTLLLDTNTGEILDITGKGIKDIENRILRTPLTARKTLSYDPKRILRGIRFKIQFNMTADDGYEKEVVNFIPYLIKFLQEHPRSKMIANTVKKTMELDYEKAIQEYEKYGILQHLPTASSPDVERDIKEKYLGKTIVPVLGSLKEAQTRMIDKLMKEREKHKAYMRRKKREQLQKTREKFKILERARNGYYLDNPEPEFVKQKKIDEKNRLWNYIRSRDYADSKNWLKEAQQEGGGIQGEQPNITNQIVQEVNQKLDSSENDVNDAKAFISEFAVSVGIEDEDSQELFTYLSSQQFAQDTARIADDAENIQNTLSNPAFQLPFENQTALNALNTVHRVFDSNRNFLLALNQFVDSKGHSWKDVSISDTKLF